MIGLQIGYTEKEIGRMSFGKWCDLFEAFRNYYNMRVKQIPFKLPEKAVSVLDL